MNKTLVSLAIFLALAVASALGPTSVCAQHGGFQGRSVHMGGIIVGGSLRPLPLVPPLPQTPFLHRRTFRPFIHPGTGLPVVGYAPPVYSGDAPPAYYDVPPDYDPSAGGTSGVIEYPSGRYELRGDGITTPFVWVWIPNPPPAPPDVASQADPTPRLEEAPRHPSSSSNSPGPKIINISGADVSTPPTDPTAPKIISIPSSLR
jgi:hypothetical protein